MKNNKVTELKTRINKIQYFIFIKKQCMKHLGLILILTISIFNNRAFSQQKMLTIFEYSKLDEIEKELQNKKDTIKRISFHFISDSIINLLMKYEKKHIELITFLEPNLMKIPDFVFLYKNLKYLYISDSRISEVPREINNFKYLEEIAIFSDRDIDILNLDSLGNLKDVSMSIYKLSKLSSVLEKLKKLENLDFVFMEDNQNLNKLFVNIAKIITLKKLTLSGLNNLKTIQDSTRENYYLKELNLVNCSPSSVNEILKLNFFININSLSITNCDLKEIPEQINNFKLLEKLNCSENKIKKISNSILFNCRIKKIIAIDTKIKKNKSKFCEDQEIILKSDLYSSHCLILE